MDNLSANVCFTLKRILGQGLEKEKYTYVVEILQLLYLLTFLDTPSGTYGCIWLR